MSEPVPPTASEYFGGMVAAYDSLIRRAVPRYEEMTRRLVTYLPAAPRRMLELGCGTGNLTLEIVRRFPDAELTIVDAATEMLDLTRARLRETVPDRPVRGRFVASRFEDLSFADGSFDLITSCISLHHVRDKAPLYRKIYGWLEPGGTFRFADQLAGGTPDNHAINWQGWLEFCRERGNCDAQEIQSLLDHAAAHDHYTPLHEHFEMLASAGFAANRLDCVWRNWIWGIITVDR